MKSVLRRTKFKLHAAKSPRKNRLEAPLNGHAPAPLSGSGSPVAKLHGHLDQLSQLRVRLYRSPISASPHYRLLEIPAISLSVISRANQKFGSGSSPDCVERIMLVPKRLSSSWMTWSPCLRWEAPFGSMLTQR
jgi:hypothetical protein